MIIRRSGHKPDRAHGREEASTWPAGRPSARYWILALLTVLVALGGGSRSPVPSLLIIRPACVLAMAALLIVPGGWDWSRYRPLAWLLGAWSLAIAIQLVPLPPSLFLALPGRGALAQAAIIAGDARSWHPISLAPDLTLDSLLTLLVPVTLLVAFAGLGAADRARTPLLLLAVVAASALLAVAQLAGGQDSVAYLYQSTSVTLPVGLFANRNHQATLMAIGLAALAWWHLGGRTRRRNIMAVAPMVLAEIIFGLVGLITGSRSGLLLMAAGLILGFVAAGGIRHLRRSRQSWLAIAIAALLLVSVTAAALLFGRAAAIDRLTEADGIGSDLRFRALPVMMRMVWIYAPIGTGFGTFDPVFRMHETEALLNLFYFNNAHDDYLEVLITGGLPATASLLAALAWIGVRAWALAMGRERNDTASRTDRARARLGLVVTVLLAGASLSDYPLRTPLMELIGGMALCWMTEVRRAEALVSAESLS